jgi:5-methylcytosine-specific restriction protein A
MTNPFYLSGRWKVKREKILRRDKYKDRVLSRYGINREATIVHHIYPLEDYPQFKWCDWNLISVSMTTHNKLHDRVTNKLTEEGIALMERTPIPEKYMISPLPSSANS